MKQSYKKSEVKKTDKIQTVRKEISKNRISDSFSEKNKLYFSLFVFILAFIVYSNTINHDYALDDIIVTTDNPLVQKGFEGIPDLISHGYFYANTGRNDESYRPLSMVVIAIETEFFGLNPKANHFFNVLYYAISCLLLFIFLCKLLNKNNVLIPFLITILFALHPIHTEVVANIKSRDEIFNFLFIVLTLLLLIDYIDKKKIIYLIFSLLAFFLALMSKENAVTFIAVIPLMLYFFRELKIKEIVLKSIPFFCICVLYFIIRITVLDTVTFKNTITVYQNSLIAATTFSEFIATNLTIHLKYLGLLLFPHPLSWDYSYNQIPIVTFGCFKVIISLMIFIGLIVYAILGLKKKNPVSFGILYYFITISIVSNFVVKIASTMGERFIFTSSLGFCIALIFSAEQLLSKNKNKMKILTIVFTVISLLYILKTVDRNKDWKNDETIYLSGVLTSPNSARTHLALADTYRLQLVNESNPVSAKIIYQKSVDEFEKAIEIYPENPQAYYNFGYMLYNVNLKDLALEKLLTGLKYDSLHRDLLNYAGIIYTEKEDFEKGRFYFTKIIENYPDFVHSYNNLAYINNKEFKYSEAIGNYLKIIEIDSTYNNVYQNIANTYLKNNEYDNALKNYKIVLSKNQNDTIALKNIQYIDKIMTDSLK